MATRESLNELLKESSALLVQSNGSSDLKEAMDISDEISQLAEIIEKMSDEQQVETFIGSELPEHEYRVTIPF